MKKKSTDRSAFLSPRALLILIVCAGACSIATGTLLAFLRGDAVSKNTPKSLTFAERVAYQRAIEDVYWRHRIWPRNGGERPDPKPPLDAVMSQAQLEKKVTDYLRKSQALEDYWQRPITAEQLQAEMDRMAKHTREPQVLRELFEALGNDPFVIAECLARPALADRSITNWYAYDQRVHGELKHRAETEVLTHSSIERMRQLGGNYSKIELLKSNGARGTHATEHGVIMNDAEWDRTLGRLTAAFGHPGAARDKGLGVRRQVDPATNVQVLAQPQRATHEAIPLYKLSSVQEDETSYYLIAVASKTHDHLKLETISWPKQSLESWLCIAENQIRLTIAASTTTRYRLPSVPTGSGCVDDTWTGIASVPSERTQHTAVWTGTEMIVWGGTNLGHALNTGDRYDPATDTWTITNLSSAPEARSGQTAIWTGTEMIVWGGYGFSGALGTGGRYNPAANTWTPTAMGGAPAARYSHVAVWTGNEMIVWGGLNGGYLNSGGRYNPGNDSWLNTSTTNAPAGRAETAVVWTGNEMIVWGGGNGGYLNTGGRYNPATNGWAITSTTNAPSAREWQTAVWTGSEMIIWGGWNGSALNTGGRFNPATNSWTPTTTSNAPAPRNFHTAVWTGSEMIVWGGNAFPNDVNTGGRYDPGSDHWTATSVTNAPTLRTDHTAIWTGNEMIIFGGSGDGTLNSGGRYNPTTDSWVATTTTNTPRGRYEHTAIWTGSEMIIWGGEANTPFATNSGGKYDPALDAWIATSLSNAPQERESHTAVWTGSEMIVWGGWYSDGFSIHVLNTGGRYNPATDGWVPTSLINAPDPRRWHTAVWSGSQMIVWGGEGGGNTGGRYNPTSDSWVPTSILNAPAARYHHTAVWTGSEMIAWGGGSGSPVNTGGRYNPTTDSWIATSTATQARSGHTAVWTGTEMIVWGGYDGNLHVNTGGRYSPSTNTWTPTTTTNAPDGRIAHAAVWTGNEMIVWGGYNFQQDEFFNTGARYNPSTDDWIATSTINAPSRREITQTTDAVWTGTAMIVWGGFDGNALLNTGGRYCAQSGPTPSPTPTPTPCMGRCSPTPRPHPNPRPRP